MSILLSINEPWHYRNWEPVLRHFSEDEVDIHVSAWRWHLPNDAQVHRQHVRDTVEWLEQQGVSPLTGPLDLEPHVFATLGIEPRLVGETYTRQVRMLYAVISKQYTYSDKNLPYDEILVASSFGQKLMQKAGVASRVVGYPKLDDYFNGEMTREKARAHLGLDDQEAVILYAPTLDNLCTYERYAESIEQLARLGTLLVQLHPVSYLKERARFGRLAQAGRMISPVAAGLETLLAADVIVTDYSGVIFEACALDTPVVLLDQPGLEQTDCVERVHRDCGRRVTDPNGVVGAVESALENPSQFAERRAYYRETFYEYHGDAGRRAADALRENVDMARRARARDVDLLYTKLRKYELGVGV